MLAEHECLKILKTNKGEKTENQVKQIRALLYQLAEYDYELFTSKKGKEKK